MKRILFAIALIVGIMPSLVFAQEPQNNLGKNYSQLSQKFPGLKYWCESSEGTMYKYGDEMLFIFKDGRLVSENMYVEGSGDYPLDWYNAMVAAFRKTNYRHIIEGDHSVIFIYSTIQIHIMYNRTQNSSSISYDYLPNYK